MCSWWDSGTRLLTGKEEDEREEIVSIHDWGCLENQKTTNTEYKRLLAFECMT